MAYTATTNIERPDDSTDWFPSTTEVRNIRRNLNTDGKRLSFTSSESDDGLTLTTEVVFDNKASYDEYVSDEKIAQDRINRRTYYTNNNVVSNTSFAGS